MLRVPPGNALGDKQWSGVVVGLCALLMVSNARAAAAGRGQVTYATTEVAFINRGAADGLTVGARVPVLRGRRTVGHCVVRELAPHTATCPSKGFLVGDAVTTVRRASPPPLPPPRPLSAAEQSQRRRALQEHSQALVPFRGAGSVLAARTGSVGASVGYATFASGFSSAGPYHRQSVSAWAHRVRLGPAVTASVDVTAWNWSRRPSLSVAAARPSAQLMVHQAQLDVRPDGSAWMLSVGRTRPRHAPGLSVLDGLQAGWLSGEGELGLFGGALPTAGGLDVSLSSWLAGAYAASTLRGGTAQQPLLVQTEGRVGWARRPGFGDRLEAGGALRTWVSRQVDAALDVQVGAGERNAPGSVDAVSALIGVRVGPGARVSAAGRYRAQAAFEVDPLGVPPLPGQQSLHADARAEAELMPGVTAAVVANFADQLSGELWQGSFGPQVAWSGLGRGASVGLAYLEDVGWLRGRGVYGTVAWRAGPRARVFSRLSWMTSTLAQDELGASASAEVGLNAWLSLSGAGLLRLRTLSGPSVAQLNVQLTAWVP